jgi:hypothetical protein
VLLAWAAVASAQHREPLPALPVERPVVLPRGWALLGAGLEGDLATFSARYAAMRRVELRVAVPVEGGVRDPELGARFRLHRSEPPNRSLALDLSVTTPSRAGVPVAALGLVGGHSFGPFLATLAVGGRTDLTAVAEPALLLQIGPLFPFARATVSLVAPAATGEGGLGLQLNRALAVQGWLGAGRAGGALEVAL